MQAQFDRRQRGAEEAISVVVQERAVAAELAGAHGEEKLC